MPVLAQVPNYLHTDGSRLVDSNGNAVVLTGINWFGLETENYALHGLWARSWESILDQIVELGFNVIRLPYSNQLFDPSSQPNGINYDLNPGLKGFTGLEIMDKIITGAGERGLKVILDRHRPDSHAQSELWYTSRYSEERWIHDWVMLVERYAGDDTVIGVDLHNEPHGRATWGNDDSATDWRLAAERAGNAILQANSNLLIIVQGVDQYQGDWYWWGGNLMGARQHPVRLDVPNRLVYSTHVYGPGVYPQSWFWDPDFPANLPGVWDHHWGYLHKEGLAPVIVGEFGGRSVGKDKEGIWQRTLVSYLSDSNLSYIYWTLNPNSGDTGGILLDDWKTVDPDKQALLSGYQFPLLGIEQRGPEPADRLSPPAPTGPAGLRLRYRTANPAALTQDSKPEFILVNTGQTPVPIENIDLLYWFNDQSDQPLVFHCDWAEVGCGSVLGEFHTTEAGAGYLRIYFQPGLQPLLPGQDSGEIKIRFNRADWSQYDQTDDYSFAPFTEYTDWEQVTLYVNGQLVWGGEPVPNPLSNPTSTVTPLPATPSPTETLPTTAPQETKLAKEISLEPTPTPAATQAPLVQPVPSSRELSEPWVVAALAIASVLGISGMGLLIAAVWLARRGN